LHHRVCLPAPCAAVRSRESTMPRASVIVPAARLHRGERRRPDVSSGCPSVREPHRATFARGAGVGRHRQVLASRNDTGRSGTSADM